MSEDHHALHRRVATIDLHSHFLINGFLFGRDFGLRTPGPGRWNPFRNMMDLPRMREADMDGQWFTVYFPGKPVFTDNRRWHDRIIDRYYDMVLRHGRDMCHCNSPQEFEDARAQGRFASFLAIEGCHALEGRVEHVDHFFRRGVRMMQLTHFLPNEIADGTESSERPNEGLNDLGVRMIHRMNELGVLVDLAHMTDQGIQKAVAASRAPVISSHTGVRALNPRERNLSDEAIDLIAGSGGLAGILFFPPYLTPKTLRVPLDRVIDHIAYVADRVGSEHVAIGTDFDAGTWAPTDMSDVRDMRKVTQRMLARGFSAQDVERIWGGNLLRVWRAVIESADE
jgi:membrane dipeptidase